MKDANQGQKKGQETQGARRPLEQRPGTLSSASDVLQGLLKNGKSPVGQSFTQWKLWHQWEEILGDEIAKHSRPVGYKRGVLFVWVENSVRMQEMIFVVKSMITKINKSLGRNWVKRIQFTLDTKNVPDIQNAKKDMVDFIGSVIQD